MTPEGELPDNIRLLSAHYRSDSSSLGEDFFRPCISVATRYRRAAGYFSSSSFVTWSESLPRIVESQELTVQLLVSPHLTPQDIDALKTEMDAAKRADYYERVINRIVDELEELSAGGGVNATYSRLFARLVVGGIVDLRIAFPGTPSNEYLFHEKFGVFDFADGSQVAFSGSANETASGHYDNFESVDVFRSWVSADVARVQIKSQQFDEAWANQTHGLSVVRLSEAALRTLKAAARRESRPIGSQPVDDANKWAHQDEAVAAFMAKRVGILEMATGTGKTRTALRIFQDLIHQSKIDSAIFTTDGTDLLDQWCLELQSTLHAAGLAWPVYRQYANYHEAPKYRLDPKRSVLLISRRQISALLSRISPETLRTMLIVHDEVHGFGVPGIRSSLGSEHRRIAWRLGLSATPERAYDDSGNEFVSRELGDVIFRFPLETAIDRGILSGFDYVPLSYELTEGDKRRLAAVYAMKAARQKAGRPMSKEEVWTELSKVYKTAEDKPRAFWEHIAVDQRPLKRSIVFVETKEYGNALLDEMHRITARYRTYYAEDEQAHLHAFARGEIDVLVTCHRLSQGIDIRSVGAVVLFSSSRSRLETIQRIGRCLRVDPNNPAKRAIVVDFVRPQSPGSDFENPDQERSRWLSEVSTYPRTS